ncbi:MAG: hypothetical protein ACI30H_02680 [Paludibacteraceae bacterium]
MVVTHEIYLGPDAIDKVIDVYVVMNNDVYQTEMPQTEHITKHVRDAESTDTSLSDGNKLIDRKKNLNHLTESQGHKQQKNVG